MSAGKNPLVRPLTEVKLGKVKLADGREVWSVGDVVIHNVQNGRTTIVTATRAYNQGYPASMFSLGTLQSIMRGGSIE